MSTQKKKRGFSRMEDAGRALDRELDRLVAYINETVVPAARQDSEKLLRRASEKLKDLADRLASETIAAGLKTTDRKM